MAFRDEDREKLTEVHTLVKGHIGLIKDHETRLRKQEQKMAALYAWVALIPFGVAVTWDWIKIKIGG